MLLLLLTYGFERKVPASVFLERLIISFIVYDGVKLGKNMITITITIQAQFDDALGKTKYSIATLSSRFVIPK